MNRFRYAAFLLLALLAAGCGGTSPEEVDATVAAAIVATNQAAPTATPLPTVTPAPTGVPASTDTPVPTTTPLPTDAPVPTTTAVHTPAPSMLETELDSGAVLYTLPEAGYSIALSPTWRVFDLTNPQTIALLEESVDAGLAAAGITSDLFRSLAAAGISFYALNLDPDAAASLSPVTISIVQEDLPFAADAEEYANLTMGTIEQVFDVAEIERASLLLGDAPAVRLTFTVDTPTATGEMVAFTTTQFILVANQRVHIAGLSVPADRFPDGGRRFWDQLETFRLLDTP